MKFQNYDILRERRVSPWNVFLAGKMAWSVKQWDHSFGLQYAANSIRFRSRKDAKNWIAGGCELFKNEYELEAPVFVWAETEEEAIEIFKKGR